MRKGAPSVNALGRAAPNLDRAVSLAVDAVLAQRKAPGTDGVYAPSGFLYDSAEKNAALRGATRWVTYDNLLAMLPNVAAAVNAWLLLASSVKWKAVENPKGGARAKDCALLVQEGLLDARMDMPWRTEIVPRQLYGAAMLGFAMHAKGTRRDSQGRVVYSELAHRPQWTIEKWLKPDETKAWQGVEQRSKSGKTYPLDRAELFYSANRTKSDGPDGYGLFRHIVEGERYRTRFRQLLGIAFENDVNGIPVGRAPLAKLARLAMTPASEGGGGVTSTDTAAVVAFVNTYTSALRDLLENRVVTPHRSLLLDSAVHEGIDADQSIKPSTVYEWSIDTVKSTIGGLAEMRAEIRELDREALRLFFAEWMMMGDGTGSTRATHDGKTSMMGFAIDGWLDRITVDADRDLVWPLVAMNGYDPETCAPTLYRESVATQGAKEAAEMLALLAKAALADDDEAPDAIRARYELPPRPKSKGKGKPAPVPAKKKPDEDADPIEDDDPKETP